MSTVETNLTNVAIKNLLYTNWSIGSPAKDIIETTENPERVWFGNRWYAYSPPRTHSHHIVVRGGRKQYRPWQLGGNAKFEVQERLVIHVWVLPGTGLSVETAHTRMKSMLDEVKRILNSLGDTVGSGIQDLALETINDASRLERSPPQLYYQIEVTAVLYEGIS